MSRKAEVPHTSRTQLMQRLQLLMQLQSMENTILQETTASTNDLNTTDARAICILFQEGSMTAGKLAVRLDLTTGAITSVLDRLESLNMIDRMRDPQDKRRAIIKPNKVRAKKLYNAYHSIDTATEKLLDRYSAEQLAFLISFFESSIDVSQTVTQKLTKG